MEKKEYFSTISIIFRKMFIKYKEVDTESNSTWEALHIILRRFLTAIQTW